MSPADRACTYGAFPLFLGYLALEALGAQTTLTRAETTRKTRHAELQAKHLLLVCTRSGEIRSISVLRASAQDDRCENISSFNPWHLDWSFLKRKRNGEIPHVQAALSEGDVSTPLRVARHDRFWRRRQPRASLHSGPAQTPAPGGVFAAVPERPGLELASGGRNAWSLAASGLEASGGPDDGRREAFALKHLTKPKDVIPDPDPESPNMSNSPFGWRC